MNIVLGIISLCLIVILSWRFKKRKIEEKDFWTIGVILFVAIIGITQIEMKYEEIIKIKQNLENISKISIKNIAYSMGEVGRWSDAQDKLKREKNTRNELYKTLKELNLKEEETKDILAELDDFIKLDEQELLRKEKAK